MSQDEELSVNIPDKLIPIFLPERGSVRYRNAYGGRGSGKSYTFAKMAAIFGAIEPLNILCTREFQKSIKTSFHAELKNAIGSCEWLSSQYTVGVDYIKGHNGTQFLFMGLRHNMGSVKSTAQIDICIIEEAEDVPEVSFVDLFPTIRAQKSEIWCIWNPRREGSPVDERFIINPPDDGEEKMLIAKLNYSDNPWFPDVLDSLRKKELRTMDYSQYAHIWEGEYWTSSDAQVFRDRYRIEEIAPNYNTIFYFGADWGFSVDPSTLIRMWIDENKKELYIDQEAYGHGVDIDKLPDLFDEVDGSRKWKITADSARPETISYMRNKGFTIDGAAKGKDSVIEGVNFIKSYTTVIHPRCAKTIEEYRLYSYKRDKLTNEVLPILEDANNHIIDAIRYALEQVIHRIRISDFKTLTHDRDFKRSGW